MSFNDNDQPLGEQFLQNPYEFFQSFVRNMNNEVFLSEYQLNHLYALLLVRKESPWDQLKPNSQNMKGEVQEMVNKKVAEVKKMLQSLSQVYEDKLKKNTFTQIERLMSILKAKNKSIFIEKDHHHYARSFNASSEKRTQCEDKSKLIDAQGSQHLQAKTQESKELSNTANNSTQIQMNDFSCQVESENNNQNFHQSMIMEKQQSHQYKEPKVQQQSPGTNEPQDSGDSRQVLSLFYGIANISNLSSLAIGNCLQYNTAQRFIKFKMSKNYIMTIKNQDQLSYDRTSILRNVSSDLYIHRIFPYLTAVELFKVRGVCKEWMENVKEAWHSTFKREMFIQLMACEFCKEIQFYYKMIQLRNPFFQKVSLLMHALVEIIQWDKVYESINNNTIVPQLKKVLIILLKLLGEDIVTPSLNSITEEVWLQHKEKTLTLKQRIGQFLSNIQSSGLNIIELLKIKMQLLDDPFMRVEELNSQDKTPLLLVIFIKQLTLQQILKNHIYFSQEYLMNTKRRLDNVSSKMPQQKGFLEGVYKIILLRSFGGKGESGQDDKQEKIQMPNFASILSSIFDGNEDMEKPDFVLKSKSSLTNIYMDKATKLDIIVSTVKKMKSFDSSQGRQQEQMQEQNEFETQRQQQCQKIMQDKMQNNQVEGTNTQTESLAAKKQLQTVNIYNINLGQQEKISQEGSANKGNQPPTQTKQGDKLHKN